MPLEAAGLFIFGGDQMAKRIAPHLRAAIEEALKEYRLTLVALERRRMEEVSTRRGTFAAPSTNPGDPTFAAVKRLHAPDIVLMEWMCRAISDVYKALSPQLQDVVRLYYWEGLRHYEAASELNVSGGTLRHLREIIVGAVAHRLDALRPSGGRHDPRIDASYMPET